MIGVAVCNVGFGVSGKLGTDLVSHIVIRADLLVLDVDVGIELVELLDVEIEDIREVRAHRVVEGDGDFASVVAAFRNVKVGNCLLVAA